jgi:hypothetical protein
MKVAEGVALGSSPADVESILRIPSLVRGGLCGYGVLRLRWVMRFALDPAPLRMTRLRRWTDFVKNAVFKE